MHILFGITSLVLSMVIAMPVYADSRHGGFIRAQMQRPQHDRFQRPPQRDFRRPPPDRGPRDSRMTDQERRDLHRDLDRAHRELYKDRR